MSFHTHFHLLLTDATTLCPPLCPSPAPHSWHPVGGWKEAPGHTGRAGKWREAAEHTGSVCCFSSGTSTGLGNGRVPKPRAFCRWQASEWARVLRKHTRGKHTDKSPQPPPAREWALSARLPWAGGEGGGGRAAPEEARGRYQQSSCATKLQSRGRSVRRSAMSRGRQRGRALGAGALLGDSGRGGARAGGGYERAGRAGADSRPLRLSRALWGGGSPWRRPLAAPPAPTGGSPGWHRDRISQVKG